MTIKVTIIDDHIMILKGLKSMIDGFENIRVYGTYCYSEDLLHFLKTKSPDIILMDIELPDISGIELCKIVNEKHPEIPIIAISSHEEISYLNNMTNAGAKGYLLKSTDKKEIIFAIKTVLSGQNYIDKRLKEKLINESLGFSSTETAPNLTKRETEIFELIGKGFTNKEISALLSISKRTVDAHRQNILKKFDVHNTAELVKKGMRLNLLK
ncbi:MAG: response regulator transcription factor [Flavobacteriales bacterium]